MNQEFQNIKVVGFDLDQTLFPKSEEIDNAIQEYIYKKIAEHKNISYEEARAAFRELYKDGAGLSGSQTLEHLGIPGAGEIVQEALERADIAKFLHANNETNQLLQDIKNKFAALDLITGSGIKTRDMKLGRLEIPLSIFSHAIDGTVYSKSDGTAYKLWLSLYPNFKPEEFLYIGDRVRSDFEVPSTFGIQSILVNVSKPKTEVACLQLPSLIDLREVIL
jgi:FMN phosphatase YigB (HAD superfamily)